MTEQLSEDGAYAFLWTTDLSLAVQVIGFPEYLERCRALLQLLPPGSSLTPLIDRALGEPLRRDREGKKDEEWHQEGDAPRPNGGRGLEGLGGPTEGPGEDEEWDGLMRFMSPPSEVFDGPWIFHKTDADYWPSVPHGHLKKDDRFKLDVYRGWAFDQHQGRNGRESRSFIRKLWNDGKFQDIAVHCLDHFIGSHKLHEWKVQRGIVNPRRLPFGHIWPRHFGV
jgi:hypothetical protein